MSNVSVLESDGGYMRCTEYCLVQYNNISDI